MEYVTVDGSQDKQIQIGADDKGQELLIGLSMSGGGSRSAIFSAAALEALARLTINPKGDSFLTRISHISAVSGGSFAASYFVTHKPLASEPVLGQNNMLTPVYQRFFQSFRKEMAKDFEAPTEFRQIWKIRWLNPSGRALSLSEVLDAEFLDDKAFSDIARLHADGQIPHLIINTTVYNYGRRLLFTNLPAEAFKVVPNASQTVLAQGNNFVSIFGRSLTVSDLHGDPRKVKLSTAVVASASVPFLIGPTTIRFGDAERYFHLADGGVFDNQGTEPLLDLFLREIQSGRAKRALILEIDSSFPFNTGVLNYDFHDNGVNLLLKYPDRSFGIMEQRMQLYRDHVLSTQVLKKLSVAPNAVTIIRLRHTDAEWAEDLLDLPVSCTKEAAKRRSYSKTMVQTRVREIETRLSIQSECDRDLLTEAARKVVKTQSGEILRFFR